MSADYNAEAYKLTDNLQQVMSRNQTAVWSGTKLSSSLDYIRWSHRMSQKIRKIGYGLPHYYENGTTGFEGRADEAHVTMLKTAYDSLIDSFLFSSVFQKICDRLESRDLSGYSSIEYLKGHYGAISMLDAVRLVKSMFSPSPGSAATYDTLFDTVATLKITAQQSLACQYLAGWYIHNHSIEGGVEKVFNAYHLTFGTEFNEFTTDNLVDITSKLFPIESTAGSLTESTFATYERKNTSELKCFNCGGRGHTYRKCPKPLTEDIEQKIADIRSGKFKKDTAWFGFLGSDAKKTGDFVFLDSSCSKHVFCTKEWFTKLDPVTNHSIVGIHGEEVPVLGVGTVILSLENGPKLTLNEVNYVPTAAANLVSVSCATEAGSQLLFKRDTVVDVTTRSVIGVKSHGSLFVLKLASRVPSPFDTFGFLAGTPNPAVRLWYELLGHPCMTALNAMML